MFFWLSWLRCPPANAYSSTAIEFILQISNDLRTELQDEQVDVYYVWSSDSPSGSSTQPVKLTAWRPELSHKLLSVPAPPLSPGVATQSWRLGLFAAFSPGKPLSSEMMEISLVDRQQLCGVLPLYSAPISFSRNDPSTRSTHYAKAGKSRLPPTKKLDEIQRVYRLPAFGQGLSQLGSLDPATSDPAWDTVTIIEKTSFDLDKRAWDSGVGLSAILSWWLSDFRLNIVNTKMQEHQELIHDILLTLTRPGSRIVELGAGSGIVSVILRSLLSRFHASKETGVSLHNPSATTQIYVTDLPSAIPLITRNIDGNCPLHANLGISEQHHAASVAIEPDVLDWEDDQLPSGIVSGPIDMIIMSDVTYNTTSFPALLKTVNTLLIGSLAARVIIAYKERHDAERTAWEMLETGAKLNLRKVDEISGVGGQPVEIWVGSRHE